MNTGQSPYGDSRGPNNRGRRSQSRRRGLTLLALVVVAIVVVVLVITVPGRDTGSSSTSTSSTLTSASSTATAGDGSSGSTDTTTGSSVGETTGTTTYTADVTGGNEVPEVGTAANGTFTLTVAADGSADYVLQVNSIISLTVARLHQGKPGATGPTILTIYGGPTKDGLFTGTIAQGSVNAKKLVGPLQGMTVDDLVGMIDSGDVYINLGTKAHPDGEIRGQLE